MELSLVAAFLGGALALLSPCGALLLPAFFAATTGSRLRLVLHGGLFFVGLSLTLVPLGLGASFLGSLITTHRDVLIAVAGWLIIAFGLLQVAGLGFDVARLVPGAQTVRSTASRTGAALRSVLLGTVSGVAGFCSGPILGAVLTMAATEPSRVLAGVMLAVYGAGMVVPLLALALLWTRLGDRGRARLRGRAWQAGPLQLHSTSVVTGVLLVVVGVVFLRTNGLATLPQLVSSGTLTDIQATVLSVGAAVPEPVLILVLALVALGAWAWWRHRTGATPDDGAPTVTGTGGGPGTDDVAGDGAVAGDSAASGGGESAPVSAARGLGRFFEQSNRLR